MLNQVSIIGNVGNKEIRTVNGKKYANLSVAVNESYKDSEGVKKETTNWFKISILSQPLAETVEKYVNKGDKLFVQGKLQNKDYEDNNGVKHYTTEILLGNYESKIVMLSPRKAGEVASDSTTPPAHNTETGEIPPGDAIPF